MEHSPLIAWSPTGCPTVATPHAAMDSSCGRVGWLGPQSMGENPVQSTWCVWIGATSGAMTCTPSVAGDSESGGM